MEGWSGEVEVELRDGFLVITGDDEQHWIFADTGCADVLKFGLAGC